MHKAYYEELKPKLYNKVSDIKQNGSFKIAVREEMAYVDKFADYERWMSLSILESKEMQIHLSKLIDSDLNQPKGSLSFDYKKELERILWNELGTVEDYKKSTDIDNLAVFIRSIVGIEQVVINEKFGEFLSGNKLNSQQQEFVKQIIDYVRENGDIKAEDLIEKSPFDSADILTLFGSDIAIITSIIATMHNSVIAA